MLTPRWLSNARAQTGLGYLPTLQACACPGLPKGKGLIGKTDPQYYHTQDSLKLNLPCGGRRALCQSPPLHLVTRLLQATITAAPTADGEPRRGVGQDTRSNCRYTTSFLKFTGVNGREQRRNSSSQCNMPNSENTSSSNGFTRVENMKVFYSLLARVCSFLSTNV